MNANERLGAATLTQWALIATAPVFCRTIKGSVGWLAAVSAASYWTWSARQDMFIQAISDAHQSGLQLGRVQAKETFAEKHAELTAVLDDTLTGFLDKRESSWR